MYYNIYPTDLRTELTHFLEDNGIESFFGVEPPEPGSKICSVLVKKEEEPNILKLDGKSNGVHEFYFCVAWRLDTSIKYMVNCKKVG